MAPEINPYESPAELVNVPRDPVIVALKRLRGPSLVLIGLAGIVCILGVVIFPLVVLTSVAHYSDESPLERWLTIPYFLAGYPILFGALSMRRGMRYRLAYTSAVLASLPFLSPFVFLGIPFGIWALIVLHRRDVKEAFARQKERANAVTSRAD